MKIYLSAGTLYSYLGKPARLLGDGGYDVGKASPNARRGLPLVAVAWEPRPTCWEVVYILERDFDRDMIPVEANDGH